MDMLLLRLFPAAIFAGGLVFLGFEFRSYRRERATGQVRFTKTIRRSLGAFMLLILAAMVYFGEIPKDPSQDAAATIAQFQYWVSVLGLALFLMGLAIWDALDGFRHLRGYLARVESEELEQLHRQLGNLDVPSNGKPVDQS